MRATLLLTVAAALAAACFVRAFGITFLGRPRSAAAEKAAEVDRYSLSAMFILAALCLLAGILPGLFIDALSPVAIQMLGSRMPIRVTRALLRGALDGTLAKARYRRDPFFGFLVPEGVPGVPAEMLDPRASWRDKSAYDATARELLARFEKNFSTFAEHVGADVKAVALRAAA